VVEVPLDDPASALVINEPRFELNDLDRPRAQPELDFWHSATFTWDGSTVLFGDEADGASPPRCRESDLLPIDGRYVAVSAAYSGGTTVFDFTDRANPVEIGHNDPHVANTWSSYWYNGNIFTNDTGRGLDVMLLADQARAAAKKLPYLNPQTPGVDDRLNLRLSCQGVVTL